MATREVPRREWTQFFQVYTEQHEGWKTTIELLDQDLGDQVAVQDSPLRGIVFESAGNELEDITILTGTAPDRHLVHVIRSPSRVWLHRTEKAEALEIETREGRSTLIRIRPARQPSLTGANG